MDSADGDPDAQKLVDKISHDVSTPTAEDFPIEASQHHSLKHHLLGPSLTKAGQDSVDQKKVAEIIYEASKGSKFFNNEEAKDKVLTKKIERILKLKSQLQNLDLKSDLRKADECIASLEMSRDLSQYVVHIDCDAFYAAVEEIDRPELKDVPMAVGIGVLTTCNYQARKYGCRSAMAGFVAKKLCPQLICLPLNFDKYTAKAREVRAILAEYDPRFESSSIDEAYMNITEYCQLHNLGPDEAVEQLRREVHEKCKITISAGIAPNAKLAKICSNKNKPNGQFRIMNDRVAIMNFVNTLPVRKVNGVGRVFERELQAIGVETCGDIYDQRAYLNKLFGEKAYHFMLQTYLGLGRTNVQPAEEYERKSVGTESTFRDLSTKGELREKLRHTAEELEKDMARVGVKGRTLVLKIKLHTYEVFTRQVAPPKAVHLAEDLYNYSLPMLAKLEKDMPELKIRLLGLRCTHLISTKKSDFDFFGKRPATTATTSIVPGDEEWEVWPDEEFEEAAKEEKQEELEELHRLSQEHEAVEAAAAMAVTESTSEWHEPFGVYKYGSETNSPVKLSVTNKVDDINDTIQTIAWDCPICQLPQTAIDKDFNAHIDSCLSRQTIREVIAATSAGEDLANGRAVDGFSSSSPRLETNIPLGLPRSVNGVKRKASSSSLTSGTNNNNNHTNTMNHSGGRQKKLFFA